jgi:fibronectin type 3 domain-containing protein
MSREKYGGMASVIDNTDQSVKAGTTYYYVVTAVGSGGVQSADSNETEATVP